MDKLLTFLGPFLKRVLSTNKFTSIGAAVALIGVVLLLTGHLSQTNFLAVLTAAVTIIGFASKDGVRSDSKVAPEDVPPFPPIPPNGAAVVLLLFAVGLFAGCSSIMFHKASAQTAPLGHHFGSARPVLLPLADADLDTLATKQVFPTAPYLVAPPAHLSPRERRKFLRVQQRTQRRALRVAARMIPAPTVPAKVKLGKGAAYNAAPDGTAVVQRSIDAPVGIGPYSPATDNSTPAPEPEADPPFWDEFKSWLSKSLKYLGLAAGAVVVGALLCLRFSPFGRAVRGAASLARSAITSARS